MPNSSLWSLHRRRILQSALQTSTIVPDRYIWAAALAIVKRYGDDPIHEAPEKANQLDEGYIGHVEMWHRILF